MTSITQQVMLRPVVQRTGMGERGEPRGPCSSSKVVATTKMLQCSQCSYSTTNASHLKTHYYRHTGEKPFSCPYCPYSCNQMTNLRAHIRRHTGEKPYACLFCSYRTGQKSNLNSHLYTHRTSDPSK